jgi:hypothetical protein
MFGSSFSFGFALSNIVTQIVGLLGNPVIMGLIAAGIAVSFSRYLLRFVKMIGRGDLGGSNFDPSNHEIFPGVAPSPDVAVQKSIYRHARRQYTKRTGKHVHLDSPF